MIYNILKHLYCNEFCCCMLYRNNKSKDFIKCKNFLLLRVLGFVFNENVLAEKDFGRDNRD